MRFTLLLASSALAASLVLSACSGGSPTVPAGPGSSTQMAHRLPQLVAPGAKHNASCPSAFFVCDTLYPGTTQQGICISTSGNCTTGLVGSWNFTGVIETYPKGKKYKKIKVAYSPNPGNPTTVIFTAKKVKNTHGKVKWQNILNACEVTYPSSCLSGAMGLIGG
ncbi:MAG TPA: hypothetical protein VEW74_05895 [Candidatus Nitrosotalea sp.]|nr:hypothetical protein [Candidatus Nitrosotalea sp.]